MKKLALLVGAPLVGFALLYALAKFNVIPVRKWARANPSIAKMCSALGLVSKAVPAKKQPVGSPLVGTEPVSASRSISRPEPAPPRRVMVRPTAAQPSGADRLARIFSQMDADELKPILAEMPNPELLRLFQKMSDDKVADLLLALPPKRATELSRAIAAQRPAN